MQGINWNDLRFVLAMARCQTLAGAARPLRVNESTVGRRIAQAEQRLGARLFERSQGLFHPTESGRAIVACAERVELEIQALETAISGSDGLAAGVVRLTTVPIILNHILVPALPQLLDHNDQLRIELIAEPRDLNLTKREADIALRLARPHKETQAIARRIGQLDYAVYRPCGQIGERLPWVTYEDRMADLPQWRWMAERSGDDPAASASVMVNDAEAILRSVQAGLGQSLLPVAIADQAPGLRRADGGPPPVSRELWLMVHPELRNLTRIKLVVNWLEATLERVLGAAA